MTAGARRKPARATVATLSALGAERLAELLVAASRGDTGLKRVLTLAVARDAQEMADEVDRQIQRLRTGEGRLTAPRAIALGRELTRLLDGLDEGLGTVDSVAASLRLLDLLELARDILARRTGEGRPLEETFASIAPRLAKLISAAAASAQLALVEPLHQALGSLDPDLAELLLAHVAAALAPQAASALHQAVDTELRALEVEGVRGAGTGARLMRLSTALAQLADAARDPAAFAAAQARRAPALRDYAAIAGRWLQAGHAPEALSALEAAPLGAARSSAAYAELRIQALDALGHKDEAQTARWELFSSRLSPNVLRAYLKRLPDFDDVEREEEALWLAERHVDTGAVLAFLTTWPDLRRAGVQVRARQIRLDGSEEDLVRQAEALASRDPLAATLLFRARIASLIAAKRPGVYAAAGRHLLDCATLAAVIDDWEGRPDHPTYIARLRNAHPRKAALWRRAAA